MKRIILLGGWLLALTACTTAPPPALQSNTLTTADAERALLRSASVMNPQNSAMGAAAFPLLEEEVIADED